MPQITASTARLSIARRESSSGDRSCACAPSPTAASNVTRIDLLMARLPPELRADAEEDGELRQAVALVRDGPLRLDERVQNGRAGLEDLARAQAERDEVVVGFQVEGPGSRRAQIPAIVQVANEDRLRAEHVDVGPVLVAGERGLPLHEAAGHAARGRMDHDRGQAALPLAGAERVVARRGQAQ